MRAGPGRIDLEGGIPRVSLLAGPSTVADVRQVLLLHRAQSRLFPTVDGCQVLVLLRALCRDDCGQDLGEFAGGGRGQAGVEGRVPAGFEACDDAQLLLALGVPQFILVIESFITARLARKRPIN